MRPYCTQVYLLSSMSVVLLRLPQNSQTCILFWLLSDLDIRFSLAATIPHEFLITGDFNLHLDNPDDSKVKQFLYALDTTNLTQHVSFPTHQDLHTLDLVITASSSSLSPIIDTRLSLHLIIFLFSLRWLFHHCLLHGCLHSLSDASNLSVSLSSSVILSTLSSSLTLLLILWPYRLLQHDTLLSSRQTRSS